MTTETVTITVPESVKVAKALLEDQLPLHPMLGLEKTPFVKHSDLDDRLCQIFRPGAMIDYYSKNPHLLVENPSFEEEKASVRSDESGRRCRLRIYAQALGVTLKTISGLASTNPDIYGCRLHERLCRAAKEELSCLVADWDRELSGQPFDQYLGEAS